MENFDLLALGWDNEPRRIERAIAVADAIIDSVPGLDGMVGFEYGCGTGLLSFSLQSHLKKIVLGDNSDGMLAVLRQKISEHGIKNMEPVKIDLTRDNMSPEQYDIIFTLMTLHHIEDIDRVIDEFHSSLKLSGYLCIADLDEEDGSFHGEGFTGHNGFNRAELTATLEKYNFSNVSSRICYEVIKRGEAGEVAGKYPVFIMTARKKAE